jgi:hypothetical protein
VDAAAIAELVERLPYVGGMRADVRTLWVELADPRRDTPDLVREVVDRGGRVMAVAEEVASLEQVYLELVGERAVTDAGPGHAH